MLNYQPFQSKSPDAITQVLKRICNEDNLYAMKPDKCLGLKLYSTEKFFPIPDSNWIDLFSTDPNIINKTMEKVKDATTIHLSGNRKNIKAGPTSAYEMITRMNCPKVFDTIPSGAVF